MLTGYNTDIKHEGTVYHVQTEDGGVDNPVIVSLVYHGGRILASRKTSYALMLGSDNLLAQLRDLLEEQHRAMIRAIITGTLGTFQAKDIVQREPGAAATGKPPATPAAPGQPMPSAAADPVQPQASASEKNLDQVILEYLASEIDKD
jgi:hypothetical protein